MRMWHLLANAFCRVMCILTYKNDDISPLKIINNNGKQKNNEYNNLLSMFM